MRGLLALILVVVMIAPARAAEVTQAPFASTRIAALAEALAGGHAQAALDGFWKEVEQRSPIVEPIAGDLVCVNVTFVWRGDRDTQRIGLMGGPVMHSYSKWLERLGESDVWYRTERIPKTARFLYSYQVNRPVEWPTDQAEAQAMWKRHKPQPDPFNLNQEHDGSVLQLSDAPPQPWATRVPGMTPGAAKLLLKLPGVPMGQRRHHRMRSEILIQERDVAVYTPPGYDARATKPYKLLVLFEGSGNEELLDNLIVQTRMPPVVMIVPFFVDRNGECECSPAFADFISKEVLAWARAKYRVSTAREDVIVGGFSYSGLAAGFCAFRHPETFGNVLAMSGSFWWFPEYAAPNAPFQGEPGWLTRQTVAATRPARPPRYFLATGRFEDFFPWSSLGETRRLRDVLRARGHEVEFREFMGGHDPVSWRSSMVEGLIALTRDRAR